MVFFYTLDSYGCFPLDICGSVPCGYVEACISCGCVNFHVGLFLLIAVGVFLAGVLEGVGGRGFDISSLLLPPSPSELSAGRPNQLSSGHRQAPGVDTEPQLVGPDHPPLLPSLFVTSC